MYKRTLIPVESVNKYSGKKDFRILKHFEVLVGYSYSTSKTSYFAQNESYFMVENAIMVYFNYPIFTTINYSYKQK